MSYNLLIFTSNLKCETMYTLMCVIYVGVMIGTVYIFKNQFGQIVNLFKEVWNLNFKKQ